MCEDRRPEGDVFGAFLKDNLSYSYYDYYLGWDLELWPLSRLAVSNQLPT